MMIFRIRTPSEKVAVREIWLKSNYKVVRKISGLVNQKKFWLLKIVYS